MANIPASRIHIQKHGHHIVSADPVAEVGREPANHGQIRLIVPEEVDTTPCGNAPRVFP